MIKQLKDNIVRFIWGSSVVPAGLYELSEYSRDFKAINFRFEKKDGLIIARSIDFKCGVILTSGKTWAEVDRNIKDAILTAFSIPSSYAKEANIHRVGSEREKYAIA